MRWSRYVFVLYGVWAPQRTSWACVFSVGTRLDADAYRLCILGGGRYVAYTLNYAMVLRRGLADGHALFRL